MYDPIGFNVMSLVTNWASRNDASAYWRRIHRQFVRQAVRELRYYLGRPSNRTNHPPCTYGHGA